MFHDDQLFNDNLTDEELEKLLKKIEEEEQDSQTNEKKDRLSATQPLTAKVVEHQNKPIDCSDDWINQLLDEDVKTNEPEAQVSSIITDQSLEPSQPDVDQVDFSDFNIEPEVEENLTAQNQVFVKDQVENETAAISTNLAMENKTSEQDWDDFKLPTDHLVNSQNDQTVNPSVNEHTSTSAVDESIYDVDSFLSAELDPVEPILHEKSSQEVFDLKPESLKSSEVKSNLNFDNNIPNIEKTNVVADDDARTSVNNDNVDTHVNVNSDEPRYYKKSKDLQKSADDIHVKIRLLKSQLKNVRDIFGQLTDTSADIISDTRHLQNQSIDDFSVSYEQMHELRKTIIHTRKELGELTSKIDLVEEAMESDLYVAETRNV